MRPSALALFMLIISSNLVGLSTGRSEGLVPLSILSTYTPAWRDRSPISTRIPTIRHWRNVGTGSLPAMILRRQRDDARSLDKRKSIAKINYRVGVLGGGRGKGGVEFLGRCRLN